MPKGVYPRKKRPLSERFLAKVDRRGPDECWLWQGTHNGKGYGTVGLGSRSDGSDYAHRVAWQLTNGPIPPGKCVCHSCDNPPCCNPAHLFLGSYAENSRDMVQKGRGTTPTLSCQDNPRAKLTPEQVQWIRSRCIPGSRGSRSASAIARELGVAYVTVLRAARGETWVGLAEASS